jgi:hypothetical protein
MEAAEAVAAPSGATSHAPHGGTASLLAGAVGSAVAMAASGASAYKGVTPDKTHWRVRINYNGRR